MGYNIDPRVAIGPEEGNPYSTIDGRPEQLFGKDRTDKTPGETRSIQIMMFDIRLGELKVRWDALRMKTLT
jgi:hypothetical protein